LDYPAKAKQYFNPLVAGIANSLEPFLRYRGKVSIVEADGGRLWFETEPGGADNDRTMCYFSQAEALNQPAEEGRRDGRGPVRIVVMRVEQRPAGGPL